MTGGPGRDHFEQETKRYPDGTVAVDALNLNAPSRGSPGKALPRWTTESNLQREVPQWKRPNWHQLSVHPQSGREESARKGAETRMRTGEAEEAARKGAPTRERLGIAEQAAKKAAATRRRERVDEEHGREA
jgi:hypothetical protein